MWSSHAYFGPGESDYNLPPIDRDDAIAREHDLLYEKAKSFKDIHNADAKAVLDFTSDAVGNWNLHSAIGAIGLGVKYEIEDTIGTNLYPHISDRVRKDGKPFNRGNIIYAESSRKRKLEERKRKKKLARQQEEEDDPQPGPSTRQDPISSPLSSPAKDQPWTISGILNEGNTVNMDTTEHPTASGATGERVRRDVGPGRGPSVANSGSLPGPMTDVKYISAANSSGVNYVFEHVHLINTWGNGYTIFKIGTAQAARAKMMITSLACLPVHLVSFWMNFAEYQMCRAGAHIVSVECMVVPKGLKTSFETGTSVTSSANNSQCVFGQSVIGLNTLIDVRNYTVERNETAPMTIDNFAVPTAHDIVKRLWGGTTYKEMETQIPTIVGIPRAMNIYAGLLHPYFSQAETTIISPGWPDLMKVLKIFNFSNHLEIPCVDYKYKVKTSYLSPKQSIILSDDAAHHDIALGGEDITCTKATYASGKASFERVTKIAPLGRNAFTFDKYENAIVEQASTVTRVDHCPPNSGHVQPSLHIGILPVQSNDPSKLLTDFVSVCGTWEVRTRCTVIANMHSLYSMKNVHTGKSIPLGSRSTGIASVYNNATLGMTPR